MHRFLAAMAICALVLTSCVTVKKGDVEVKTFGAANVLVDEAGAVTTESEGLSEGLVEVLRSIPEAVLRILGAVGAGFAAAPTPAPAPTE